MTRPEYAAPEIACNGKDGFTTMNLARKVASDMNRRHKDGTLNAYKCPYCGNYHVGNVNKKGKFYGKPKPRG